MKTHEEMNRPDLSRLAENIAKEYGLDFVLLIFTEDDGSSTGQWWSPPPDGVPADVLQKILRGVEQWSVDNARDRE